MREKTFGGMHCQTAPQSTPYYKFTTLFASIEPQKLWFFTELFNHYNRQVNLPLNARGVFKRLLTVGGVSDADIARHHDTL